jgi:hypothetical protein
MYSGWWEPVIGTAARPILERSAERFIEILHGDLYL